VEPSVNICKGFCGAVKRSSPRSRIGLIAIIGTPRLEASLNVVSMRGWLVPGLWPMQKIQSLSSKSSNVTVPLPTPIDSGRPTLVASWHIFEQSGKLLVPNSRTNN
jgi:hypothetical protein